jgi:hypothetical protein
VAPWHELGEEAGNQVAYGQQAEDGPDDDANDERHDDAATVSLEVQKRDHNDLHVESWLSSTGTSQNVRVQTR